MKFTTRVQVFVLAAFCLTAAASANQAPASCWKEIYQFPEQQVSNLPTQEWESINATGILLPFENGREVAFSIERDDCSPDGPFYRARDRAEEYVPIYEPSKRAKRSRLKAVFGVIARIGLGGMGAGFAMTGNVPGVIGVGAIFQSMGEVRSRSEKQATQRPHQAQPDQRVQPHSHLPSPMESDVGSSRPYDRLKQRLQSSSRRPIITATVR